MIEVGRVFETNRCGSLTVVDYIDSSRVVVMFNDKHQHKTTVQANKLKSGSVKNPYHPRVYGVGFVGVGRFKTRVDGKNTLEYTVWTAMMSRCYNPVYHKKHPTYLECSVHPDWHNFQVFAEWYINHESYGLGYHLDKDLLVRGNKIYSENTCCLLPSQLNMSIQESQSRQEDLPTGVTKPERGGYRATLHIDGKNVNLGYFETVEEARLMYKSRKEGNVRRLADLWKDRITKDTYDSLKRWELG